MSITMKITAIMPQYFVSEHFSALDTMVRNVVKMRCVAKRYEEDLIQDLWAEMLSNCGAAVTQQGDIDLIFSRLDAFLRRCAEEYASPKREVATIAIPAYLKDFDMDTIRSMAENFGVDPSLAVDLVMKKLIG